MVDKTAIANQLVVDEAVRLKLYDDATGKELKRGDTIKGNVSIGVGRNLFAKGIRKSEYELMLYNDINDAIGDLDTNLPWWRSMSEIRQQVIVNMCFNMGIGNNFGGLLSFHNTLQAMKDGRYADAAQGMRNSAWAKQVGPRSERLAKMMENG